MTNKEIINKWLAMLDDDYEVAIQLNKNEKYLKSLFFCQQAVEKLLKVTYIKHKKENPPYTHDLVRLYSLVKDLISEDYSKLLESLNPFYIKSRYPSYKEDIFKIADKEFTKNIIQKTGEFIECMKTKMK
jgi:HEPN domain-containing protein